MLEYGKPPGLNKTLYKNLVVYAYAFELEDGTKPERDPKLKESIPRNKHVKPAPYGDHANLRPLSRALCP